MKLVLLVTLTAASLACGVQGQNVQVRNSASSTPTPHLYSVTLNGKYGFIDESGNLKFTEYWFILNAEGSTGSF